MTSLPKKKKWYNMLRKIQTKVNVTMLIMFPLRDHVKKLTNTRSSQERIPKNSPKKRETLLKMIKFPFAGKQVCGSRRAAGTYQRSNYLFPHNKLAVKDHQLAESNPTSMVVSNTGNHTPPSASPLITTGTLTMKQIGMIMMSRHKFTTMNSQTWNLITNTGMISHHLAQYIVILMNTMMNPFISGITDSRPHPDVDENVVPLE